MDDFLRNLRLAKILDTFWSTWKNRIKIGRTMDIVKLSTSSLLPVSPLCHRLSQEQIPSGLSYGLGWARLYNALAGF